MKSLTILLILALQMGFAYSIIIPFTRSRASAEQRHAEKIRAEMRRVADLQSDFWPHRIRRSLNAPEKYPQSQEEMDAFLLNKLDAIRNKTWLLPEFDFDNPQLPQLPRDLLLPNLREPFDSRLTYLNAEMLKEPKMTKHFQELCLNTTENESNKGWCKIDPDKNQRGGRSGGSLYMKFTKSDTGLWQLPYFTSTIGEENMSYSSTSPSPTPSNNEGQLTSEQRALDLDDPELPELPPAMADTPKECRYFVYLDGLISKLLVTHFFCRKDHSDSSEIGQAEGWCQLQQGHSSESMDDVFAYVHNTKHGVWFIAADCSLGFKNKIVKEFLWNGQKNFFPN